MRKKKTIAELVREHTGHGYFRVYAATDNKPLRWQWIDYPIMPFAELLQFTGLPKGRIESYQRYKIVELSGPTAPGSGHDVLYSPRDALRLLAADGLRQAGAWARCLENLFRRNGEFDLILNTYQVRVYSAANPPQSIRLNTQVEKLFYETGQTDPYKDEVELNLARIRGEWPRPEWAYLIFDTGNFLSVTMPKLIGFIESKGVSVKDR